MLTIIVPPGDGKSKINVKINISCKIKRTLWLGVRGGVVRLARQDI